MVMPMTRGPTLPWPGSATATAYTTYTCAWQMMHEALGSDLMVSAYDANVLLNNSTTDVLALIGCDAAMH